MKTKSKKGLNLLLGIYFLALGSFAFELGQSPLVMALGVTFLMLGLFILSTFYIMQLYSYEMDEFDEFIDDLLLPWGVPIDWSKGLYLGKSGWSLAGVRRYLPHKIRSQHSLVMGTTGAGKTTTLRSFIFQDFIRPNTSTVILDGKGDKESLLTILEPDFKTLTLGSKGTGDLYFNPLLGTPDQVCGLFDMCLEWSEPYYKNAALGILKTYLSVCKQNGEIPTCRKLIDVLDDPMSLGVFVKGMSPESPEAKAYKAISNEKISDLRRIYSGFRSQLSALAMSNWSDRLEADKGGHLDNLDQLLQESLFSQRRIYVGLAALAGTKDVNLVGRLILARFIQIIETRTGESAPFGPERPYISLYIDEFASVVYEGFEKVVAQGRSLGVLLTLATQTFSDMSRVGKEFANQIISSSNTIVCHCLNAPQDADILAKLIGSTDPMDSKWKKFLERLDPQKFAKRRMESHFKVSPDELKDLPTGWAWVVTKSALNPDKSKRVFQVRVDPIDKYCCLTREMKTEAAHVAAV